MGIELPAPQHEQSVAPASNAEREAIARSGEINQRTRSAEIFTSERPSVQEVKTGAGAGDGFSGAPLNDAFATTVQPVQTVFQPSVPSLDDVPVVAADEDLIEKQWVDSVKKVIKDTRNDPYTQSAAIGRLQADYLQKRYGKTLGQGDGA